MREDIDQYISEIRDIISRRDEELAHAELEQMHPADIAELYQALDLDEAEYLYNLLDELQNHFLP